MLTEAAIGAAAAAVLGRGAAWMGQTLASFDAGTLARVRPWERPAGPGGRWLAAAGQTAGAGPLLVGSVLCAVTFAAVLGPLAQGPLLVVGLAGAALVPWAWASFDRAARASSITQALPSALRALLRQAVAGQALGAAIADTARSVPGALGAEFKRVAAEQQAGRPLPDALRDLADRAPDAPDLRIAVEAMLLAVESEGDLPSMLERTEAALTARLQAWEQARAATTQARLNSGLVVAVVGGGGGLLSVLAPGYLEDLWADPTGRMLAQAALAWLGLGLAVIAVLIRSRP